jgi:hypothetical protein
VRASLELAHLPKEIAVAALAAALAFTLKPVRLDPTDALTRLELLRSCVIAHRCEGAARHASAVQRALENHAGAREVVEAYAAFCP